MATEPNLRHLFDAPQPPATIDVASVVRRSRARRVPKVLGVTGVSVLAIGGMVFGGVQLMGDPIGASDMAGSAPVDSPMMSQADESAADGSSADSLKRAPAELINLCGAQVADIAPSATGLVLTTHFADAAAGTETIEGTVTLSNTGSQSILGYTAVAPAITLSQHGTVLWHSTATVNDATREVSLAPGESIDYQAWFSPVVCGPDDDARDSFRAGLPSAAAGSYQVSAALDLMGDFDAELITGPTQTITLN